MPNEEKWTEVITKLTEQTEAGQVNWQQGSPFGPVVRENDIRDVYSAPVQGRWVLVYEYTYRSYSDEDVWTLENEVSIEFIDTEGKLQWKWPKLAGRWQLIEAIRYRISGAHEFLQGFLHESPLIL